MWRWVQRHASRQRMVKSLYYPLVVILINKNHQEAEKQDSKHTSHTSGLKAIEQSQIPAMSSSSKGKSVVRTAPPLRFPKSIGSPVPFLADPLVGHNTVDYHPGANIYTPQMLLQTTAMVGDAMYKLLLIDVVKSKTEDQITALNDYLSNAFQRQFLELIGLDVSSANDHHAGTLFEYHFAGNHRFRWKFVEIQFPNYFRLAWERAGGEGEPNINVVIGEAYQALNTNE